MVRYRWAPRVVPGWSAKAPSANGAASGSLVPASPEHLVPHLVKGVKGAVRQPVRAREQSLLVLLLNDTGCDLSRQLTIFLTLPAQCLPRRALLAFITPGLDRRSLPHRDDIFGPFQRHELGLGQSHTVALALGNTRQIVNRRFPGLPAMADREVQGMKVRVLAHALPALLGGERSQEEGHGLPVLLGHDGGPGWRAIDVAVLLTPVLATRMAGVKGLQSRLEQRALFGGLHAVGSQDRELVAAVLLAQPSDEVLTVVVLRQSRGGEQGDSE